MGERPDPGPHTGGLHAAGPDDVLAGRTSPADLWAMRAALEAAGSDPPVVGELRLDGLPGGWPWAVLCGLEEALSALEGSEVEVLAVPEGSVIYPEEPVLRVSGRYSEFGLLATPMVGMLALPTGVATAAARLRLAAGGRPVHPMDLASLHPAVVGVVERAAHIGGCDGALTSEGSRLSGAEPLPTAGPELSLLLGEPEAWARFDAALPDTTARIVTVGGLEDERTTAVAAAEFLGERLAGVRIEAPWADPGRLLHLAREVRWELDSRGRSEVRVIVSGDLSEEMLPALAPHVDGFGVGNALWAARAARFSFDIVEVDGEARSRRGTLSGRKSLWRCEACGNRGIAPTDLRQEPCPRCGGRLRELLVHRLTWGVRDEPPPEPGDIRARALKETAEAPV